MRSPSRSTQAVGVVLDLMKPFRGVRNLGSPRQDAELKQFKHAADLGTSEHKASPMLLDATSKGATRQMDREREIAHLMHTDKAIALCERHIADQERRVAQLDR